ncbi:18084_t:CDS:2 [Gigaspora rosea]|nr:18084_t:CDS:2 [Gigaspora rosea]
MPYTLLNMFLLPLIPKSKNTYLLINLSIPYSNDFSSYLMDSFILLFSTLLNSPCSNKLNATTIKDNYLLPRIDDLLDTITGSFWYNILDLASR